MPEVLKRKFGNRGEVFVKDKYRETLRRRFTKKQMEERIRLSRERLKSKPDIYTDKFLDPIRVIQSSTENLLLILDNYVKICKTNNEIPIIILPDSAARSLGIMINHFLFNRYPEIYRKLYQNNLLQAVVYLNPGETDKDFKSVKIPDALKRIAKKNKITFITCDHFARLPFDEVGSDWPTNTFNRVTSAFTNSFPNSKQFILSAKNGHMYSKEPNTPVKDLGNHNLRISEEDYNRVPFTRVNRTIIDPTKPESEFKIDYEGKNGVLRKYITVGDTSKYPDRIVAEYEDYASNNKQFEYWQEKILRKLFMGLAKYYLKHIDSTFYTRPDPRTIFAYLPKEIIFALANHPNQIEKKQIEEGKRPFIINLTEQIKLHEKELATGTLTMLDLVELAKKMPFIKQ